MKYFKTISGIIILPVMCLTFGCAHHLEVKNIGHYQPPTSNSLTRPLNVGVVPQNMAYQKLIQGIASQLSIYQAKVVMPCNESESGVDVLAKIDIDSEYKGSGWNFLINFPGFLIFAPAWHGYMYNVSYTFNVQLSRGSDHEVLDTFSIPVVLNVRHADTNRTWTEVSYLEVGAIALIGGVCFINYDESVTPLLDDNIHMPIGNYIAQEIINRINTYNNTGQIGIQNTGDKTPASVSDRLIELNKLKDNGIITEEDFNIKKEALLKEF